MTSYFRTYEHCSKERSYHRKLKRDSLQAQKDKLPNELRGCLDGYNHRNDDGIGVIDANDYAYFKD